MADTNFPLTADDELDDLPRTLRREREARQRKAREEEARKRAATLTHDFGAPPSVYRTSALAEGAPAVVTRFNVPFVHLMMFFMKAVLAAIPALILLGVLIWYAGAALKAFYPQLIHTEIIIRVPR